MTQTFSRFCFIDTVPMDEVDFTLFLATLAAESIYGRERIALDSCVVLNKKKYTCDIETTTEVGHTIALIFSGYLSWEFGDDSFDIEPY